MSSARGNARAKARRDLARIMRGGPIETRDLTDWASVYDAMPLCALTDLIVNGKTKVIRERATRALARRVTENLMNK